MNVTVTQKGDFSKTEKFLAHAKDPDFLDKLDKYGRMGVNALRQATPKDTGKTADSWDYIIRKTTNTATIIWTNSNVNKGVNVALLIQYGHGVRGGYVQGIDYINPALKPVFDKIAKNAWKEVTSD